MRTLILTLLLAGIASASPPLEWALIWQDEFNGARNSSPDRTKWGYDLGAGGWGNGELEEYTNNRENVFLDGRGHLAIRAARTQAGKYTSARLKTQDRFEVQYGKIEARIKVPFGQGIWPAFWMLGNNIPSVSWPICGEIDIMENVGKEASTVHATVHGPGYSGGQGISAQVSLPGTARVSDGFHIFGVEWSAEQVEFFLDRSAFAKVSRASLPPGAKWVYDHPFFILLNVAVGGGWPGLPDRTTKFPQTMLVDWIRVWRMVPVR